MSNSTVEAILKKVSFKIDDDPIGGEAREIMTSWIDDLVQYISQRLYIMDSDLIEASFSLSYAQDIDTAALPTDFQGLTQEPWLNGQTVPLSPLPDKSYEHRYSGSGEPRHYKVRQTNLILYPPTSEATTVKGFYNQKPTEITKLTDTIPWNGLFDGMIREALVETYKVSNPMIDRTDKVKEGAVTYLNMAEFKRLAESSMLRRNFENPRIARPPKVT